MTNPNPEQDEQRCLTQAVATVVGPPLAVATAYYLNRPKDPPPPPQQQPQQQNQPKS